MNILEFFDQEKLKEVKNEFEFRYGNFKNKYYKKLIEFLKEKIKESDIKSVYNKDKWYFTFCILGSDIKILDPDNPNNAFELVRRFFTETFKDLEAEFLNYQLEKQEDDNVYINITIKNPIKK